MAAAAPLCRRCRRVIAKTRIPVVVDEQFRRPGGPQAPIIEDPLYGKDSADYVAFSSSCQPVSAAAAAKGPGKNRAIP
jgi:hypothetical protein